MGLAGVVLSGGVSKRFGGDKLIARVDGTPVIRRVCSCLRQVTDQLYLSVNSPERGQQLGQEVGVLVDGILPDSADITCVGPIKGIGTVASKLSSGEMLVTSGDTPWLQPEPLRKFVEKCRSLGLDTGSMIWGNGMVDTLIQFLKLDYLHPAIQRICAMRGEMARPSDLLRGAARLGLVHAVHLTDDPFIFSNVNTPEELVKPRPRGPLIGNAKEDVILNLFAPSNNYVKNEWNSYFWRATHALATRSFQAEEFYEREGEMFLSHNVYHLAVHAFTDALRCAESLHVDSSVKRLTEKKERAQALMQT